MSNIPAIHFEAKVRSAIRRTNKSGDWFSLTLEVHPNDFPEELREWAGPAQQQVQVGMAKVGDDGQPEPLHQRPGIRPSTIVEKAEKPRKHWDDMPRSQRAGILCADESFIAWSDKCMAAMNMIDKLTNTAEFVRWYCSVSSRADIPDDDKHPIAERFDQLVYLYRSETGQIAEKR